MCLYKRYTEQGIVISDRVMYPCHNHTKQRIRNGELIGYELRSDYPGSGECLVQTIDTMPALCPIRLHRYGEYADVIAELNAKGATTCRK